MKKPVIIILTLVAILFCGYAGYRTYRVWKRGHMSTMAREYMAKGDTKNALLALQQVLRADGRNLEACRMMADLSEQLRLPTALMWRSHVVDLNPTSLNDRLTLVQSAMTMKDFAAATNALAGVQENDKKTATFHSVAGAVAASMNQIPEAEAHFIEASRLEPQNPFPQLNLAVVRLHSSNSTYQAEARSSLRTLSANPTNAPLRCQAIRELAVDAMGSKQFETSKALSKQLLAETNSSFSDKIIRLEILKESQSADFAGTLKNYEKESEGNSDKIFELAHWEMVKLTPAQTLAWLRSMPVKNQIEQPAALLITECFDLTKDWAGLENFAKDKNWGEMEFVRHAYYSRALKGLSLLDSSKVEWQEAVKTGANQKQGVMMLLRFAVQWNMENEAEELLWKLVVRYPSETWARQALLRALYLGGRTRSMMQVYVQEAKRLPNNLPVKNDLAMLALLLDAQEVKPHDLAKEVYQSAPTNASYAGTYAFSLYLQQKNGEALKLMQSLPPKELQQSVTLGGYYGLMLKAAGKTAEAKPYLEATTKIRVLPEERKLFDRARSGG